MFKNIASKFCALKSSKPVRNNVLYVYEHKVKRRVQKRPKKVHKFVEARVYLEAAV